MSTEESHIVRFFENRSVFITGGTGFVGKALIEKLLRSCPNIGYIYLLMRPKYGVTVQERLEKLTASPVFEILKQKNPENLKKLVPIEGDITSANLGISNADEQTLFDNVSVIIHSAATVKFDEVMSLSADINVGGVQRVLALAKKMKNICAIVHISTAYSNCDKKTIREVVYPVSFDPAVATKTFAWLSEPVLKKITPEYVFSYDFADKTLKTHDSSEMVQSCDNVTRFDGIVFHGLIGNKPNTYTYTKSLAEHLVQSSKGDLPVCIVRPSIVTATIKEPLIGWVDNFQGASGILIAHGKGLLGATLARRDVAIDWIPVDYLVNMILAAAWDIGTSKSTNLMVYNCCSTPFNPLVQDNIEKFSMEAFWRTPFNQTLGYPSLNVTMCRWWSRFHNLLAVLLPSLFIDVFILLSGREPVMLKYYKKARNAARVTTFFRSHEWNFVSENLVSLWKKMTPADKKMFNFNVQEIDWQQYLHNYIHGLRKYVLKEDDRGLTRARNRLRRITLLYSFLRIISCLAFIGFSTKVVKPRLLRLIKACVAQ